MQITRLPLLRSRVQMRVIRWLKWCQLTTVVTRSDGAGEWRSQVHKTKRMKSFEGYHKTFVLRTTEQALRRRTFSPRLSDRRGNATSEGGDEAYDQAMEIDEARQIWQPLRRLPPPRAEESNPHKTENEIEKSSEWEKEYDEAMCK
uniref:Uncharacterized protein n=1 Tax=Echinococcus granulosus TaxID=6210 RepID=A0A068WLV0_ECHGR|nr:hypothetical protein EgrG_001144300 [Echinococcus granulosus]